MDVLPAKLNQASEIAKIHSQALSGDFLPSLGINFLNLFYEAVLDEKDVYGFVCKENKKIVGFVLGTGDSKSFFSKALKNKFFPLSIELLKKVIENPKIVKNIFETLLYPGKDIGPKAELVVIAVLNNYQRKGLGKKLVEALENTFKDNKIPAYKLTVHSDKAAVGFYERLGYRRLSTFNLYSKMWYLYMKSINEKDKKSK